MFEKIVNNEVSVFPYTMDALRADKLEVSFPAAIPDATLADFGSYPGTKKVDTVHASSAAMTTAAGSKRSKGQRMKYHCEQGAS